MTKVLRLVGGPYDGSVQTVADSTSTVQVGIQMPEFTQGPDPNALNVTVPRSTAIYRRRAMQFADNSPPVEFLCWSEMSDRQAMNFLLKQPDDTPPLKTLGDIDHKPN